jgi:predicted component of type VI protein secretion system
MKLDFVIERPRKKAGRTIPVRFFPFLIGRGRHCKLRPANATVSKKHCAVLMRGDRMFVRDLNSTNGTFVNGLRIRGEGELRDGDHLKIGRLELRIWADGDPFSKASEQPCSPGSMDEAAARYWMSLPDDHPAPANGETVLEQTRTAPLPQAENLKQAHPRQTPASEDAGASLSAVAGEILKKYRKARRS